MHVAAIKVLCGLLTIERAWSRGHATSSVTAVNCHRRANAVEQSARAASATGHHFQTIQTIAENVYVWLAGLWHHVSEH